MGEPGQRDTDAPFGPEEAEAIRRMLATGVRLECPRCREPLESGTPVAAGGSVLDIYMLKCPTCRRALFTSQLKPTS